MPITPARGTDDASTDAATAPGSVPRIALVGNPNTGKTSLFNRLSGLRSKTSNFPGTTQEARVGRARLGSGADAELIDLPGVYSLELAQAEAQLCREVLAGDLAPEGEDAAPPDAVCVVLDASNLARNLVLAGEAARRRTPMVLALNMTDVAARMGLRIDAARLADEIGCSVVPCNARTGEGVDRLRAALEHARIPNRTPPGDPRGVEQWADDVYAKSVAGDPAPGRTFSDRLDEAFTHPILGLVIFAAAMAVLFWALFRVATFPMDWIDTIFASAGAAAEAALPPGVLRDMLVNGVIAGIGATVIFLPQIALLFFLIALLEDTGYLARAAFVMDRALRPFGLPGHAFVPLLSSHACALPGIMATRAIPDRRQRLATILVAPFMTCSARLPVYVLLTTLLFRDRPGLAGLAFTGCYLLGAGAGLLSALVARRTILRGDSRPMAMELPTFKAPNLRNAALGAWDRSLVFLKKAGTVILAISIVLWWLSAYPVADAPPEAQALRAQAAQVASAEEAAALDERADRLEASHQQRMSFAGRAGRAMQPVFEPLGYDWRLTIGVLSSFAAREVFVSTMAVVIAGEEEMDDESLFGAIASARRDDGVTPVFTAATSWSLLIYYVLAMQCLPTLAVTAREAGGWKWALLQLAWMSGLAYLAALLVHQSLRLVGVA